MKVFFYIFFIFFQVGHAYAQFCVVNFITIVKENQRDTFYFDIIRFHDDLIDDNYLESKIVKATKNRDTIITSVKYKINSTICAIIGDGWGHEIIISPEDTVDIFCEKYPHNQHFLKDSLLSPWNFKMTYKGKSKSNFELFDSLAYLYGALHKDYLFFSPGNDKIEVFFQNATNQYTERKNYIDKYAERHHVTAVALKFAYAENKYNYLSKLISVFFIPKFKLTFAELPKNYIDSLIQFEKENLDLFDHTKSYSEYLQNFTNVFKGKFLIDSISSDEQNFRLLKTYAQINNIYIKEYFSTRLLKFQIKQHKIISKKTLEAYRSNCSNRIFVSYIDSLIKNQPNVESISFTKAVKSQIIFLNDTLTIEQLLDTKPTVIDCWASWCKPCILQMKYSKSLEEKYKNKINFIYLSFDRNREDWIAKTKELGIEKNNYLLLKNFKSPFANFFDIFSIPRYIIIGRDKKVIISDAPKPSKIAAITNILDKIK